MDLPKDIRLLVYEQCDLQRKHYRLTENLQIFRSNASHASLIVSCFPAVKLLQTCSEIHDEARPIFQRNQLRRMIDEPTRLFFRDLEYPHNSAYLMDILLLMTGLRTTSRSAPDIPDLGHWLHTCSWGHEPSYLDHQPQVLSSACVHQRQIRLIVCVEFEDPTSDYYWRSINLDWLFDTVNDFSYGIWKWGIKESVTQRVNVDFRVPPSGHERDGPMRICVPFSGGAAADSRCSYATYQVRGSVGVGEWQRDWAASD